MFTISRRSRRQLSNGNNITGMETEFNARCPHCGEEFYIESAQSESVCPKCGEKCSAVRANKYFLTIHATKEEFKEAHGEDYHKEMLILDEAYGYISLGDYENAEKKVNEALELTDSDYKVFMAMVAVKTKNYTDLRDESHKEFINKAIALADSDGKKEIKQTYRPYYLKRQLTDGELNEYHKEEAELKKKKVENSLKNLIPNFDIKEKRQKLFLILYPILFAVGAATSIVLFFIADNAYSLIGFPFIIAGYVLFRMWFMTKDNVKAFNALLDLFDALDGADSDNDKLVAVYNGIQKLADRFADGESTVSMSSDTALLLDALIALNNEEVNSFLLSNKYFSQYVSDEE